MLATTHLPQSDIRTAPSPPLIKMLLAAHLPCQRSLATVGRATPVWAPDLLWHLCVSPTNSALFPPGRTWYLGIRDRAIAGTKLDPSPRSTDEEPFLDTSVHSQHLRESLAWCRDVLALQKWDVWRVGQKNPGGTFSPTPCILQASYKDMMRALAPFHAAPLLRNEQCSLATPGPSPCPDIH